MSTQVKTTTGGTQEYLQQLARDVVSQISGLDPSRSKELLGVFVSEMFRSVAEQERRETNRQRQAEGIAAAREQGVRFGRERLELPESFPEFAQLWQDGRISSRRAAEELGMSYKTFQRRAKELCAAV